MPAIAPRGWSAARSCRERAPCSCHQRVGPPGAVAVANDDGRAENGGVATSGTLCLASTQQAALGGFGLQRTRTTQPVVPVLVRGRIVVPVRGAQVLGPVIERAAAFAQAGARAQPPRPSARVRWSRASCWSLAPSTALTRRRLGWLRRGPAGKTPLCAVVRIDDILRLDARPHRVASARRDARRRGSPPIRDKEEWRSWWPAAA